MKGVDKKVFVANAPVRGHCQALGGDAIIDPRSQVRRQSG
jgi:hypothetical protein